MNTFNRYFGFLSAFVILGVSSCGKNKTEILPQTGKLYFPLLVGKELVYDVDSVIYDPQPSGKIQIDTFKWQVREVIKDTFKDQSGIIQYRTEHFSRVQGAITWISDFVFTSALTLQHALRNENNLTFIKFPLIFSVDTQWEGNVYIDPSVKIKVAGETLTPFTNKWTYQILSIDKPEQIGTRKFDSVLTIVAQSNPNILNEKRYTLEKYAKGIGLVYREQKILDTQKLDGSVAWEVRAEKGFIVTQKILSF